MLPGQRLDAGQKCPPGSLQVSHLAVMHREREALVFNLHPRRQQRFQFSRGRLHLWLKTSSLR